MSKAEEKLLDYRRNVVPTKEGQWTSASGGDMSSMQGEQRVELLYFSREKKTVEHQTFMGRRVKWMYFCPLRTEYPILPQSS